MGHILVQGLGKAYRQYPSQWSRLREWISPWGGPRHAQHWVLRDISFALEPGESVGIIGMNGAGKSTLLKMLTGTTRPTTGQIRMQGRVAALLELGMGFHPEFTGRQNIYMAGQLLGYSSGELTAMMADIAAFADIGDYLDQPVRVYSSGMQMRLAFSVATATRPDILIVDEALSVGDAYFQHKSFARIRQFREQGTTLLIVSHDKQAIQSVCDKAILLHGGSILQQGPPEAVMDYYNAMLAAHQDQSVSQSTGMHGRLETVSGTGEASVVSIALHDAAGQVIDVVAVGQAVTLRVDVQTRSAIDRLVLGYGIKDRLGQVIFGTNTHLTSQVLCDVPAHARYRFDIRFDANLGPGSYSVQTALVSTESHLENNYEWRDLALIFNVINTDKPEFAGCSWFNSQIEIHHT